jgi:hypothetical protein
MEGSIFRNKKKKNAAQAWIHIAAIIKGGREVARNRSSSICRHVQPSFVVDGGGGGPRTAATTAAQA